MKWRNLACDSETCPGFFVNGETHVIERCDTCQLFKSDADASLVLEALAKIGLETLMQRPRAELEIAAALGRFVIATLNKDGHASETQTNKG